MAVAGTRSRRGASLLLLLVVAGLLGLASSSSSPSSSPSRSASAAAVVPASSSTARPPPHPRRDIGRRRPASLPAWGIPRGGAVREAAAAPPAPVPPAPARPSPRRPFPACLVAFGFLGGISHALCNKMFDVYTSLMTGHFLNLSILLAEGQWSRVLWRASVIWSYGCGVAGARAIEVRHETDRSEAGGGTTDDDRNGHFRTIAPLVLTAFVVGDRLPRDGKVAVLACGYGMIYPSVAAALGGTMTHLITGHTNNVARLVGEGRARSGGATTSLCVVGSVVSGTVFGTRLLGRLGGEFPYFTVLGFLYAAALLLLL